MRKFLTCITAVAVMAVASPASAKVVGEYGSPSREWKLEQRLERMSRHLHWYKQKTVRLNRQIERLTRPTSNDTSPAPSTSSSFSSTPTHTGCLSAEQVASYARGAGFPESAIPQMVAYADRESGFCTGAINSSSGACGLWQIYPAQPGCTDPATNAHLAYEKYAASGFSPWGG